LNYQNVGIAAALEKVEMNNAAYCKKEGARWLGSQAIKASTDRGYHCVSVK